MKIVFVIPGTKIKLLENAETDLETYGVLKNYKLQKGDELKVSQVYIRQNGWFQSSLTFKAAGGPIMDHISTYALNANKIADTTELQEEEAKLVQLNSLGADVEWFAKGLKTLQQYRRYYGQAPILPTSINEYGTDKQTYYELVKRSQNNNSGFYYYQMQYLVRSDIEKRIAVLKKKLAKPQKRGKMNFTFRVKLSDIESWEVEIER